MFHKPDDVKDFDQSVLAIHSKLESSATDEIECDVLKIMRSITWHDWTTDWAYTVGLGDNLKPSDGNLVRQFAHGCVLFLDRLGDKDLSGLRIHADEYLTQRGIKPIANASGWHDTYFTVAELTRMRKAVNLSHSSTTMTREIKSQILNGRIQRDGSKPMKLRVDLYNEWNTPLQ